MNTWARNAPAIHISHFPMFPLQITVCGTLITIHEPCNTLLMMAFTPQKTLRSGDATKRHDQSSLEGEANFLFPLPPGNQQSITINVVYHTVLRKLNYAILWAVQTTGVTLLRSI